MNNITSPQRPRAFVVRVLQDAEGNLRGQISEPSSADEWRETFVSAEVLWQIFAERLARSAHPNVASNVAE